MRIISAITALRIRVLPSTYRLFEKRSPRQPHSGEQLQRRSMKARRSDRAIPTSFAMNRRCPQRGQGWRVGWFIMRAVVGVMLPRCYLKENEGTI
jgi:hypothetical protein